MKDHICQFGLSQLPEAAKCCQKLISFPLTPALSLGEREKRSQFSGEATAAFCSEPLKLFGIIQRLFPLPLGEGQGEGKVTIQKSVNHRIALP
jgi:hypothetical protein